MSAFDHGIRQHATWSASSTARNWRCSGALALGLLNTKGEKESIHAATGTAGHQVSERCLRDGSNPVDYVDTIEKTKQRDIPVDNELAESAQMYVDHVRSRVADGGQLQIEQRFSLAKLKPPFDAGGTADAVLWFPNEGLLEVIDFKNGRGLVDVNENKQLRTYGLGAALANPDLKIAKIRVTIVQPRAPHEDGAIRSETFSYGELIEWTIELMSRMKLSKMAQIELEACGSNSILFDEWCDKWLTPGNCTFCPREGDCPALRKRALEAASVWCEPDEGTPHIANKPGEMTPEALGKTLDMLPMIEDWIKAVRGHAHNVAEAGTLIPNYQLAEKIGNRVWGAEEEKVVADLRSVVRLTDDQIFAPRKLRSVAQIEKVLGTKREKEVSNMWIRPVKGTNLVSMTKTTREPVMSRAERFAEKD